MYKYKFILAYYAIGMYNYAMIKQTYYRCLLKSVKNQGMIKESVTLTEILWKKREIWKATDSRKEEM